MKKQSAKKRPVTEDENKSRKKTKTEKYSIGDGEDTESSLSSNTPSSSSQEPEICSFNDFRSDPTNASMSKTERSIDPLPSDLGIGDTFGLPFMFNDEMQFVESFDLPNTVDNQQHISFKPPETDVELDTIVQPICFNDMQVFQSSVDEQLNKNSPKTNRTNDAFEDKEDMENKELTAQRLSSFEEELLATLSETKSGKDEQCSDDDIEEALAKLPRKALFKDRKHSLLQQLGDNVASSKSNAESCDNSDFEFSDSISSGIGQIDDSNDESHSSYSPISFENSDDNLEKEGESSGRAKKLSRKHLSPNCDKNPNILNMEAALAGLGNLNDVGPTTDSALKATNQSSKSTKVPTPSKVQLMQRLLNQQTSSRKNNSTHKSQPLSQEPLSFIAEAMQATDPMFPNLKPIELMETSESPIKTSASPKSQSAEEQKNNIDSRTQTGDNNSPGNSGSRESLSVSCAEKKRHLEEKLTKMSSNPKERDEKCNISPGSIMFSPRSAKDTDSDDSVWRRKSQASKNDGHRDFYEDDSTFEDDKLNSDDDEDHTNSDLPYSNLLNDYEQLFHEIRKIIDRVPNRFKYEIYNLLYPTLAVVYLRMISSGKYRKGKAFVESCLRYIDHSYMARVDKLMVLQTPGDMPIKARKLISDENAQVPVSMFEETYYVLLLCMESWSRSLQMTFIRHFDLFPDYNNGEPRQHSRIGSVILDKIFWATPETVKDNKESSPRPMRRRRFKKDKPSPTRNVHLPSGNRLYTPTPKRWDLERHKDDEERRVPLNRNNLPSTYLYTALESVETIICATFSNKTTMLSIGTASSAIHVFALTASKLVQIKSAKCLKRLDTSMSGIDESMLDATKRKTRRTLYGHQGAVYGCTFAPHDRFLLSCAQDRTVRCWCLLSWSCVVVYPGHCGAVYSVSYAPLGYYFATASDDRTARIWTQDSKKSVCILVGHLAEVVCCQFHPNRHYLATGSADCTVRMWDIVKAVQVRVFSGHRSTINDLAYSMCGRYLASGADDNFVIVWDADKEELVRCLSHHTAPINCIKFALDNKLLMVGGNDCQMTIWDFERLVQEYDPEKQKTANSQNSSVTATEPNRSELSSGDFLIKAYASRGTPFYKLCITRRNLLLGFCVKRADYALKESKETFTNDAKYTEWLEFLDILKLKSIFAQKNKGESNEIERIEEPEQLINLDVDTSDDELEDSFKYGHEEFFEDKEEDMESFRYSEYEYFEDDEDSDTLSCLDVESFEDDDEDSQIIEHPNCKDTLSYSNTVYDSDDSEDSDIEKNSDIETFEGDECSLENLSNENNEENSYVEIDIKETDLSRYSDVVYSEDVEQEADKLKSPKVRIRNADVETVKINQENTKLLCGSDIEYLDKNEHEHEESEILPNNDVNKGTESFKYRGVECFEDNKEISEKIKNSDEEYSENYEEYVDDNNKDSELSESVNDLESVEDYEESESLAARSSEDEKDISEPILSSVSDDEEEEDYEEDSDELNNPDVRTQNNDEEATTQLKHHNVDFNDNEEELETLTTSDAFNNEDAEPLTNRDKETLEAKNFDIETIEEDEVQSEIILSHEDKNKEDDEEDLKIEESIDVESFDNDTVETETSLDSDIEFFKESEEPDLQKAEEKDFGEQPTVETDDVGIIIDPDVDNIDDDEESKTYLKSLIDYKEVTGPFINSEAESSEEGDEEAQNFDVREEKEDDEEELITVENADVKLYYENIEEPESSRNSEDESLAENVGGMRDNEEEQKIKTAVKSIKENAKKPEIVRNSDLEYLKNNENNLEMEVIHHVNFTGDVISLDYIDGTVPFSNVDVEYLERDEGVLEVLENNKAMKGDESLVEVEENTDVKIELFVKDDDELKTIENGNVDEDTKILTKVRVESFGDNEVTEPFNKTDA
ncbi:uncharacterized protein Dvir_GJ11707 [Drosophila virilis]|uniref:TFIID subunit TAF5 NTD2 domain-containing protein n=1 Tax=Drosophila virilis TaxID=7244 RepID=B4LER8_DROVI|nr:uncharacterized protein Dvir_GJ11707 [Drosophila virilis]